MNSYLEQDFPFGLPFGAPLQPSFLKLEVCAATSKTILMFEQTLDPSQGYGQAGGFNTAGQYTAEDARAEANGTNATAVAWEAMSSISTGTLTGEMTFGTEHSRTHKSPNEET